MEKATEPIKSILTLIKDDFFISHHSLDFEIFPQMPKGQVNHFVKQAVNRMDEVAIQLNPSPFAKEINEVIGTISLSPTSDHIILETKNKRMTHLIQTQYIRHLRLTN